MRFLHTADLHLGRKMNDIVLLEDQKYVLDQIVKIGVENKVDCILISGDIYNNTSPTPDTMLLFNYFINELAANNIKAYIISGNHDSDKRLSYLSNVTKLVGINISNVFNGKLEHYVTEDEFGKVNIYMLPFIKPIHVRSFYPEEKISSYQDAVSVVLKYANIDTSERNILLAHQFITGANFTDVEELSVGGLENIDADVFDDFDYVALGHIHGAQQVKRETLRYSGSIMKYSFSEEYHIKSVTLVDFNEKGNINFSLIPLKFKHNLRTIIGSYDKLIQMPYSEDFVRIILTNDDILPDARVNLSMIFPNMLKFSINNSKTVFEKDVVGAEVVGKNIFDLFSDFYSLQNCNVPLSDEHTAVLKEIIKEMEGN